MMRQTGKYERSTVTGSEVSAFIPFPLPPRDPPLKLDGYLAPLLARAIEQLRLLDLAGDLMPSVEWFVYAFVRKEAVLSAQIEGTQATCSANSSTPSTTTATCLPSSVLGSCTYSSKPFTPTSTATVAWVAC